MADERRGSIQRPARNPALGRLDALVGEWKVHASIDGQPVGSGRTTFAWMESGAFLVQRTDADPPPRGTPAELIENRPEPVTTIIGLDDSTERFCMLYADARGVLRVYQMSLSDGVWKIWRNAPGFFQRFTGTFGDDGKSITGRWETAPDGATWKSDFDLTYTKVA